MQGKPGVLGEKSLFLFDLDGVFYKGKETRVELGGRAVVQALRSRGKKVYVLTNDSTDTVQTVRSRLSGTGIEFSEEEILTSARLTAEYLASRKGPVSYFLVGEEGLESEMARLGHRRVNGERSNFVVVGLDRHLSYEKLDLAARNVRNGASIVATHRARLYMYKDGPAVAAGPIVRALEYATGEVATVIGKPATPMFSMALERANCRARDTVMIGDQLETDVAGARRMGIDSILVTTGVDRDAAGFKVLASVSNVDEIEALL